jgi:hypothetical protein
MDNKKMAAAISAVMTYIKTSEEAAAYCAAEAPETLGAAPVVVQQILPPQNAWGLSGRQTQMQANSMMQLRMFK